MSRLPLLLLGSALCSTISGALESLGAPVASCDVWVLAAKVGDAVALLGGFVAGEAVDAGAAFASSVQATGLVAGVAFGCLLHRRGL